MNSKTLALGLLVFTALGIAGYPVVRGVLTPPPVVVAPPQSIQAPKIEVVFVLDTTGSMSGLIQAAKEKIWSIATSMAQAQAAPEIRMGLVAYRDRGDAYVTRAVDLSADLDTMYATLVDFQAQGGGDTPESVNAALADAIHGMSWSADADTYRAVFLVGDSPGHDDYADERPYPELLADAAARGIVVNTIRCGTNPQTETQWRHIAALTQGSYFSVDQAGSAIAVATPYDDAIAALSAELDETVIVTGSRETRHAYQQKLDAADKIHATTSTATRARRAAFNLSASGAGNLVGDDELVEAVASGRVDVDDVPTEHLPASLAAMAPAARKAHVEAQVQKRVTIRDEMAKLIEQRDSYLVGEVAETEAAASLDYQIFDTVKKQAAGKGLVYEEASEPKI